MMPYDPASPSRQEKDTDMLNDFMNGTGLVRVVNYDGKDQILYRGSSQFELNAPSELEILDYIQETKHWTDHPAVRASITWQNNAGLYNPGEIYGEISKKAGHPIGDAQIDVLKSAYFMDNSAYIGVYSMESHSFDGTQPFTVSAWIKPLDNQYSTSNGGVIVSKWDDSGEGEFFLSLESDGKLKFARKCSGCESSSLAGSIQFNDWNHAAASYDGEVMKIYINGNLKRSQNSFQELPGSDIPVFLGAWIQNIEEIANFYEGALEDARVYNYALSDTDIANLADDNAAYKKTASQSSTSAGYGAALAVDGDMTTFSKTITQDYPWLKIKLGGNYYIDKLIIQRGNDCDCAILL